MSCCKQKRFEFTAPTVNKCLQSKLLLYFKLVARNQASCIFTRRVNLDSVQRDCIATPKICYPLLPVLCQRQEQCKLLLQF